MEEFKTFLDKIGYTVRFHRVQKNLTQREVAAGCNLGFRTYQRIESGEVFPRLDTLLCIARFLKIPFPVTSEHPSPNQLGVLKVEQERQVPQLSAGATDWAQIESNLRSLAESILKPHLAESVAKSDLLAYRLLSNNCDLSPQLQSYISWKATSICLDDYIQGVRPVEIWELAHRLNAKIVLTKHVYKFPTLGTMCILAVNFVIQSAPDIAEAVGFLVDVTSPEELNRTLSAMHAAANPVQD